MRMTYYEDRVFKVLIGVKPLCEDSSLFLRSYSHSRNLVYAHERFYGHQKITETPATYFYSRSSSLFRIGSMLDYLDGLTLFI